MDISQELWQHVSETLIKLGWFYVGDSRSGVMWKNSCLFVMHGNFVPVRCTSIKYPDFVDVLDLKESGLSCFQHVCDRRSYTNPKRCLWHIEQDGWLIAKGMLSEDPVQVEKELQEINAYSSYSSAAINQIKTREVFVDKEEAVLVAKSAPPNFGFGSYFRACDPKVFNYFREGVVYKIAGVDEDTQQLIIKTMNDSLTKERKVKDFLADVDSFVSLANGHLIETVVLDYSTTTKQVSKWIHINDEVNTNNTNTDELPQQLQSICKSKVQEHFLTLAYNSGYNVTALLLPGFSRGYYEQVFSCLRQSVDVAQLAYKSYNEDFMLFLLELLQAGYNIQEIQEVGYSMGELKDILTEVDAEFQEIYGSAVANYSYPESIGYLKALYYESPNVNLYLENKPRVYLELLHYNKLYSSNITADLLSSGFINPERVYLNADSVKTSDKLDYVKSLNESCSVGWSEEEIELFVNDLSTVSFIHNTLQFESSKGSLGCDSNSVYLTDSNGNIRYRKILLEDTVIEFGRKELFLNEE